MGGMSIWHWVVILVIVVVPIVFLARILRRSDPPEPTTAPKADIASRLRQLDALKASRLVTDLEYQQRRTAILRDT